GASNATGFVHRGFGGGLARHRGAGDGVRGGIFGGSARRRRREIADRRRRQQVHPRTGEAEGIGDWVRWPPSRPAKQQANLGRSAAGASSRPRFWLRRAIGITV